MSARTINRVRLLPLLVVVVINFRCCCCRRRSRTIQLSYERVHAIHSISCRNRCWINCCYLKFMWIVFPLNWQSAFSTCQTSIGRASRSLRMLFTINAPYCSSAHKHTHTRSTCSALHCVAVAYFYARFVATQRKKWRKKDIRVDSSVRSGQWYVLCRMGRKALEAMASFSQLFDAIYDFFSTIPCWCRVLFDLFIY